MSRKRRMKTKLKRCFAMFLSLCIMFSMFQGVAWADVKPEEEGQLRDVMIELDGERLLSEAGRAIREQNVFQFEEYGMSFLLQDEEGKLVISEDYRKVLSSETGTVYAIDDIPYVDEAAASEVLGDAMLTVLVKVDDQGTGLGTASNARRATGSNAEKGTPGNAMYADGYELTGDEQFIFLLVNPTKDEINLQISINGQRTGVISVGRESALPAGEVVKENKKAEGAKPSESKPDAPIFQPPTEMTPAESVPELTLPEGTTETSEAVEVPTLPAIDIESSESGTEETESEAVTDTEENAGTESSETDQETETGSETEEIDRTENAAEATEETEGKEEAATEAEATEEEGNQEELPEERDSYETDGESGSGDSDGTADLEPNEEAPVTDEEEAGEENAEEENQLSVSGHKAYRVGMSMGPIEGFVDEDDRDEDWEEGEDASEDIYFSDEVIVVSEDTEGVELETYVLPTVLMEMSQTPAVLIGDETERVVYTGRKNSEMPSAGIMMLSASSLGARAQVDFGLFRLNLYDYNAETINTSVGLTDVTNETDKFFINKPEGNEKDTPKPTKTYYYNAQNTFLKFWANGDERYSRTAFQGIMAKRYSNKSGKEELTFASPYNAGGFGSAHDLFPENGDTVKNGVTPYFDVKINDGVFQYNADTGHYTLSALNVTYESDLGGLSDQTTSLYFNDADNSLNKANDHTKAHGDGFWPLDYVNGSKNGTVPPKKESFGMKLSFDFWVPSDGLAENKDPMKFSFAGDDDVWVYIKEQGSDETARLALDLGGIHGLTTGNIDFESGVITHNSVYAGGIGWHSENKVLWYLYDDLTEEQAKTQGYSYVVGLPKPEAGGNYTLDFYYMERGGTQSSCYIDFNMAVIDGQYIGIQKNIRGETTDNEFTFQVVSCSEESALSQYRKSNDHAERQQLKDQYDIQVSEPISIIGTGRKNVEIEEQYFYVEETELSSDVKTVEWSASGVTDNFTDIKGKSRIYDRGSNNRGFRIVCTNVYGGLSPEIYKSAWKKNGGIYDLALEVVGDSLPETSGGASGANVLFLLDSSAAMAQDLDQGVSKWETLKVTLNGVLGSMLKETDDVNVAVSKYYWDANQFTSSTDPLLSGGRINTEKLESLKNNYGATSSNDTRNIAPVITNINLGGIFGNISNRDNYIIFVVGDKLGMAGIPDSTQWMEADAIGAKEGFLAAHPNTSINISMIGLNAGDTGWMKNIASSETDCYDVSNTQELESILGKILLQTLKLDDVTNPVVFDTLSDHVEPADPTLRIWLKEGRISETGVTDDDKKTELSSSNNNGLITYSQNGKDIAWYNSTDSDITVENTVLKPKTIKWKVADTLEKGKEKSLILQVKATGTAQTDYPDTPSSGTGTHALANEKGYYSNGAAYLEYLGGDNKNFPQPVVQPESNTLSATLTVKKVLANPDSVPASEENTEFEINLNSENVYYDVDNKTTFKVENTKWKAEDSKTYNVFLGSQQGGTITVDEILGANSSFQLDSVTAKDAQGKAVSVTGGTFTITPDSQITVTVTNRYVNHNPIQIQKFVNGKSDDETKFSVNLTECEVTGTGSNRQVKSVGKPITTTLSAKDGKTKTALKAADTVKYYIVEEEITAGQPYILDSIQAIDEADGKAIGEMIDGKYVITVTPTGSPLIEVFNKTYGKVRVVKAVKGDNAPSKEFMIHVENTDKTDTYVDTTAIIQAGEKNASDWIMIDRDTTLRVTETQLKEFRLDSVSFQITDLVTGTTTTKPGSVNLVRPGEEVVITVTNTYDPQNFFDGDSSKMNDFKADKTPVTPIVPHATEVAMAVERRFLTTEEGAFVLEPRELPERLL